MRIKNKHYAEIIKLYPFFPDKKIAEMLGLRIGQVRGVGQQNGLKKSNYYWSEEEDNFLRKNYAQSGPDYCADKLKRSYTGTVHRWKKIKD